MSERSQRFDKFTERARKVLSLSHEEAARLNHNYIGTEHLLLGLVREGEGVAARVLSNMGVTLTKTRQTVELIIGRAERPPQGEIGLTQRARRVIELAFDEARRQNHHYIGTEHLLMGLVREGEGIGAGVLESQGVSLEKVRAQVIQVINQGSSYSQQSRPRRSDVPPGVERLQQELEELYDAKEAAIEAEDYELAGRLHKEEGQLLEQLLSTADEPADEPATPGPTVEHFDKFTERASKVLSLAREEAARMNHNYIGTEHLLLGLVREGDGVAARVLANMGVQLQKVRAGVEFIIGRGERPPQGEIELTPRALRVIELAFDETRRQNHDYISTEHLLLGLVREGEGIAAGVLESLGVSLQKVRVNVIQVINAGAPPRQSRRGRRYSSGEAMARLHEIRAASEHSVRYTERGQRVLDLAQEEAIRLGHDHTGTEHLLLGLLAEGEGLPARALTSLGVTLERARQVVEAAAGRGETATQGEPGFNGQARAVLNAAATTSRASRSDNVGSVDILIGLLGHGGSPVAAVLGGLGLTADRVRAEIRKMLS